jgi:hypothetical protein
VYVIFPPSSPSFPFLYICPFSLVPTTRFSVFFKVFLFKTALQGVSL